LGGTEKYNLCQKWQLRNIISSHIKDASTLQFISRIALKCHMIYLDKSQLRIVWIATNHNLITRKFSLGKISEIIYLGKSFFGRFSSEYTWGQIYNRQKFFLAVQHSYLSLKITLWLAPSCNFLARNTRVSGLLEKISGKISVPWFGILYIEIFYRAKALGSNQNKNAQIQRVKLSKAKMFKWQFHSENFNQSACSILNHWTN
jgi:hypothetical protein